MRTRLASLFLLLMAPHLCLAHAPYEFSHGDFVRADGAKILVVEYFTDGILGPDPSSIIFRKPDGTDLAKTEHTFSTKAVRIRSHSVEILDFNSNWIPIASAVQVFNGHTITNLPPSQRAWISPVIHVTGNWRAYFFCTFLVTITAIGIILVRRMPNEGEWQYLGKFAAIIVLVITGLLALAATLASPTSPIIVALLAVPPIWATNYFGPKSIGRASANSGVH